MAIRSSDQLLLTCGTNSYRPICSWRRLDSLTTTLPNDNFFSGDGKSPYNNQFPSTYTLIDTGSFDRRRKLFTQTEFCSFQGELYSATSNEPVFGVNDPLIQRSFTQGKQLRTQQHDSNWLRSMSMNKHSLNIAWISRHLDPYFVRILDIGSYVYTFFREIALEHLSCGTVRERI